MYGCLPFSRDLSSIFVRTLTFSLGRLRAGLENNGERGARGQQKDKTVSVVKSYNMRQNTFFVVNKKPCSLATFSDGHPYETEGESCDLSSLVNCLASFERTGERERGVYSLNLKSFSVTFHARFQRGTVPELLVHFD